MYKRTLIIAAMLVATFGFVAGSASVSLAAPTCADELDIANHGQHVVGEYVTGLGLDWPPGGGVKAAGGADQPGGPAAGGHFGAGVAPGASFCVDQSQSPGLHPLHPIVTQSYREPDSSRRGRCAM